MLATTTIFPAESRYSQAQPVTSLASLYIIQNVTHCKRKSPTFVSRPHFYLADPSYVQQFQYGLVI